MKNVTISLPEEVLEKLRDRARAEKMSLNAWLRALLSESVGSRDDAAKTVVGVADRVAERRSTWKWDRDEAHER